MGEIIKVEVSISKSEDGSREELQQKLDESNFMIGVLKDALVKQARLKNKVVLVHSQNEIHFHDVTDTYGWMCNGARTKIVIDGLEYYSVEGYYQSQKTTDPEERERIRLKKHYGHTFFSGKHSPNLRPDWNMVKYDIMEKGVRAKLDQHPALAYILALTGDKPIFAHNCEEWGCDNGSENLLGKLYEKIRKEKATELKIERNKGKQIC